MKVAIMQPYAFPYIGYFQLISYADKWVIFDDIQYISKGWINRNRILHPDEKKEWQYLTVPIQKHARDVKIKDIEINNKLQWRDEFLGKLTSYKKKAPYYKLTREFVGDCLNHESSNLSRWIEFTLKSTCEHLSMPFDYSVFSEMEINTDAIEHAGQWAKTISVAMGADEYVNPAGGQKLFNPQEFSDASVSLKFLQTRLSPYVQRQGFFVPGLSIIDVMMWNDASEINQLLAEFSIVDQCDLDNE